MGTVISVDQNRPARDVIDRACDVLVGEGVLVMPTDSVYGIGCLASPANPALWRIFDIKHRDRTQTLPWLVADEEELARYGHDVPSSARSLAAAFWPGALTLVVEAADTVPPEYRGADGTIALRMPDSNLVRDIARGCGIPLAVTSANTHGLAAATSGANVEPQIVAAVDLTLDAGPAPVGVASTIVDCAHGAPRVLREGAITREMIERVLAG
ncbi:MAG: threonylcarbamoyl-AMP synthase [Atopobiaceae bacterium]|nr:threonylcarbamoyl-AMP synthase [Atopobiaceae bacterium]